MTTDAELAYCLEGELNEARAALAVRDQQLEAARRILRGAIPILEHDGCYDFAGSVSAFLAGLDVQEAGQ